MSNTVVLGIAVPVEGIDGWRYNEDKECAFQYQLVTGAYLSSSIFSSALTPSSHSGGSAGHSVRERWVSTTACT